MVCDVDVLRVYQCVCVCLCLTELVPEQAVLVSHAGALLPPEC